MVSILSTADKDFGNIISEIKAANSKIGLCHGCFDVLHFGHIHHFEDARSKCDFLIVSITPDEFIKKGLNRPVFNTKQRVTVLKGIRAIDLVILHPESDATLLLEKVRPCFYFKGADYASGSYNENFNLEKKHAETLGVNVVFTEGDTSSSTFVVNKMGLGEK